MRKLFLTLALAVGLGIVSPMEVSAKKKPVVTKLECREYYDYVEYDDGSYAFFYPDGSYDIYIKRTGK